MKPNTKAFWAVVGIIALLGASNYGTYWATNKIGTIATLEEKVNSLEQGYTQSQAALTDGPKAK